VNFVDAHFGSPIAGRSPTIWVEKSYRLIEKSLSPNDRNNGS